MPSLRTTIVAALLLTASSGFSTSALAQCIPSFPMPQVQFGDPPRQIATGDLNADGIPDIVGTQERTNQVGVCFGQAAGGFAAPTFYPVGTNAQTLTLADLDGANGPDIVVGARGDGTLSALLNDGAGGFTAGAGFAAGTDFFHLISADINGDGFDDISACESTERQLTIYFSDGLGGFTFAGRASYLYPPYGSALGDLDADGLVDLAVVVPHAADPLNSPGVLNVYFNQGNDVMGVWQGFSFLPALTNISPFPQRVRIANLDAAGPPEIVVACDQIASNIGRIDVLSNPVSGVFQSQVVLTIGGDSPDVAVADLTGDSMPDLIGISSVNNDVVSVFVNDGAGAFPSQVDYDVPGNHLFQSIETADLDGDGDQDVVLGGISGQAASTMLNLGAGTFGNVSTQLSGDFPNTVKLVDINKDGRLEVLTASGTTGLSVHLGNGDGTVQPEVQYAGTGVWGSMPLADIDADTWLDTAVAEGTAIRPLMSNQLGGFVPGTLTPAIPNINTSTSNAIKGIEAGDLDGNGTVDLAVTFYAASFPWNRLQVFLGDGLGGFTLGSTRSLGSNAGVIHAHDVDGDLDTDLIVLRPYINDGITVLYNDGTAGFASGTDFPATVPVQHNQASVSMATADLDGDGDIDVALANSFVGNISILENLGNGVYSTHPTIAMPARVFGISAGDVDDDGDLDLAVGINQGNTSTTSSMYGAQLVLNQGAMSFAPSLTLTASIGPWDVALGDLDGDAIADMVIAAASVDSIDVLLNGGCGSAGFCAGDANADLIVNFDDIISVLSSWLSSYAPGSGPGDADGNGVVNFDDVTAVLSAWGIVCP